MINAERHGPFLIVLTLQLARQTLTLAGVPFEDVRVHETWMEFKGSKLKLDL